MKIKYYFGLLAIGLSAIAACKTDTKKVETAPTNTPQAVAVPKPRVEIPLFSQDSAYNFVEKQVAFGARVPNTAAHKQCRTYLVNTLKRFGATVTEQDFSADTYTGMKMSGANIIGSFNPTNPKRIILSAHWDSRFQADQDKDKAKHKTPVMGADDGASGVGILLEIARCLKNKPIDLGVDIILFDIEDQGADEGDTTGATWCLGSQYWARVPHVKGYKADFGILLDMVGAKGAVFPKEGYSMYYAPQLTDKVWQLGIDMGYINYFVNAQEKQGGFITDDHYAVNKVAGIKMIDIINRKETGFGAHWHTSNDNMKVIDKETLKAVGRVVTAVAYKTYEGSF
jgi:Zn-dependent M28 family amino/carboxypeptidase